MDNFNLIFNRQFNTSQEAVDFCQYLSHRCGFSVRIRTSKASTVYLVCSREGVQDKEVEPFKPNKKRTRASDRCSCKWKIVLYRNFSRSGNQWEFRSGKTTQHNHNLFLSEDYVPALTTRLTRSNYHPYNSNSTYDGSQKENGVKLPPIDSLFSIASEAQSSPNNYIQPIVSNLKNQSLPSIDFINSTTNKPVTYNFDFDSSSSSPKLQPTHWDLKLPPLTSLYHSPDNIFSLPKLH